jgi:predicted nucleotidyltransferase
MPSQLPLNIPIDAIGAFCRKWRIRSFSVFGSILRDDFSPTSDVDVLIDVKPDAGLSLFDVVRMREELVSLFGRDVDLVFRDALVLSRNQRRRDVILQSAEVLFAEAG